MARIVTYKEGRFAQLRLESGERILFSIAQTGIVIFRLRLFGLVPGEKIAEWLPQDLDRFTDLFSPQTDETLVDISPFRFAVDRLATMKSIQDIREYLMVRH